MTVDDELVAAWLDHLRSRRLSPNTVRAYSRVLRSVPHPATATADDIDRWWRSREHLASVSRVAELAALRSFYTWCRRYDHRAGNDDPTYRIEPPRVRRGLPRPIGRSELLHLLDVLEGPDRRAVCLGAWAGLRVSEAAALDWSDVDTELMRLRVLGKGSKVRLVGLSPMLLDSLLPRTGGNVVTGGGITYTANALQSRVNRLMRQNGVDATFHQLRHRYGTIGVAATGNLLAVGRAMGHADPSSTAIYAASSDSDLDVIAAAVLK